MAQLASDSTTRTDSENGLEARIIHFNDEDRPPKVTVRSFQPNGIGTIRIIKCELTRRNARQLYGKDDGISVSSRVYDLIEEAVAESPVEMPNIE